MPIADLQVRQGKIDLEFEIVEKEEPRTFEKFGKTGKVCNAVAKDDSGTVKLTLWNDDCDNVNVGDKVHIINGYVGEWQGEKQLSTGKFGKLEVVEKGSGAKEEKPAEEKAESKEETVKEEPVSDE